MAPPDDDPRAATEPDPAAPSLGTVEHYSLIEELGRGGMGVVYRAWDTRLRRLVALKMVLDRTGASAQALERFRREAALAAGLRHPNLVPVYDAGAHEGRPFIVMELVQGESLEARLRREPLPPRQVAEVVRGVALALAHAHERGVIHRDVKPGNVLLDEQGAPRLMDFGLARDEAATEQLTRTGEVLGTPAYMAPEQVEGDPRLQGPRTDVHALGAVLYRALGGRPPFAAANAHALLFKVLHADPEPLRALAPGVHADLETIAQRCLAKEPERRYASAGEVADELGRYLAGEPILARPEPGLARAWRRARRSRALLTLLPVTLVLAAVLGARLLDARRAGRAREEQRASLVAIVSAARSGGLEAPREREAALGLVARGADPELAAALLASELESISDGLAAAARQALLAAERPAPDEARAGASPIEGLPAAIERLLQRPPGEPLTRADEGALAGARRRLAEREARARQRGIPVDRALDPWEVVAAAQAREVGEEPLRLARFLCEALGALGRREGSVAALGRHLQVEASQLRAVGVARALCRLGGLEAQRAVLAARRRFGAGGLFWSQVARALAPGSGEQLPLAAATAEAHAERGELRQALGDLEGALQDYERALTLAPRAPHVLEARGALRALQGALPAALEDLGRALELDPSRASAWRARGEARRLAGDLPGALADLGRALELDPADPVPLSRRGLARLEAGDLTGALEDLGRAIELDPLRAEAWDDRAALRLRARDWEGALADAARALELDPWLARAWDHRGHARERQGDAEGAIADHSRALELDPELTPAWSNRAKARAARGDVAGALADCDQAARLAPLDASVLHGRASTRALAGDRDGALADIGQALRLHPGHAPAHALRAALLLQEGDPQAVVAEASQALALDPDLPDALSSRALARLRLGDPLGAVADLSSAVALEPRDAMLRANLGGARGQAGDLAGGIADLSSAIELEPTRSWFWQNRGKLRAAKGDLKGGLSDASRAIELAPGLGEHWVIRAEIRQEQRDFAGVVADTTRALELLPRDVAAWLMRARARDRLDDLRGALADYARVLELTPGDPGAWFERAVLRAAVGDLDGAAEDMARALELDPGQGERWGALANVHERRRAWRQAIAAHERALALLPERAASWRGVAWAYGQCGHIEAGIALYTRALQLEPHPLAWANRGYLRGLRGDHQGTVDDLGRSLELSPRQAPCWALRGDARAALGDLPGALADWRRSLELAPQGPDAARLRARIERER